MELAANSEKLSRSASDIWRSTLTHIPTVFGRLVRLATLRDSRTGKYTDPLLAKLMGSEDADRTLRHSHHQVFMEWIGCSLASQKADLDDYLREEPQDLWLIYRRLVPAGAREVERQLYFSDMETLLELLGHERPA
jgi:hypothetical protein